ncbi:hypothetical protein J5690_04515, partial [bacterium]|nr:hypothetical protein [bacterium]
VDDIQPTANSQQPTANSQQPTANSQQPTANSQQSILIFLGKSRKFLIKFNACAIFYYLCGASLPVETFPETSRCRTTKWRKK